MAGSIVSAFFYGMRCCLRPRAVRLTLEWSRCICVGEDVAKFSVICGVGVYDIRIDNEYRKKYDFSRALPVFHFGMREFGFKGLLYHTHKTTECNSCWLCSLVSVLLSDRKACAGIIWTWRSRAIWL